jgi:hypothetical protein
MQIEVIEEREIKGHYILNLVLKLYKFFLETFMFEKKWKMGKCDGNPKILMLATWKFTLEAP